MRVLEKEMLMLDSMRAMFRGLKEESRLESGDNCRINRNIIAKKSLHFIPTELLQPLVPHPALLPVPADAHAH